MSLFEMASYSAIFQNRQVKITWEKGKWEIRTNRQESNEPNNTNTFCIYHFQTRLIYELLGRPVIKLSVSCLCIY